mmetsp:Transcript_95428/g.269661  ORF Transcript_95428/g.269661 Transcript_95428/m.269661 type:complete len:262 (+) Transcript_95428:100-885(+)
MADSHSHGATAAPQANEATGQASRRFSKSSTTVDPHLERSAGIWEDPKMRELQSHLKKHGPQAVPPLADHLANIRCGGRDMVDTKMKELAREPAGHRGHVTGEAGFGLTLLQETYSPAVNLDPRVKCGPSSSPATTRHRMERFNVARMRSCLRDQTDRTLKRLFVDMDLARDDRQRPHGDRTRCEHLDKVFDWYRLHNLQEEKDKTERKAPPYLVFSTDSPVPPGSMRVQPLPRSPLLAHQSGTGLSRCPSAPATLRVGAS